MDELELLTADNDRLHLTVAINYGGRDEVPRATTPLAEAMRAGPARPEDIDAETPSRRISTPPSCPTRT